MVRRRVRRCGHCPNAVSQLLATERIESWTSGLRSISTGGMRASRSGACKAAPSSGAVSAAPRSPGGLRSVEETSWCWPVTETPPLHSAAMARAGVGWQQAAWNRRRLAAVAADTSRVADVLHRAATATGSRPGVAYALLYPDDRRAAIPYFGPAFLTKYLYFAGGGAPDHPTVILDSRIAARLRNEAGWFRWTAAGVGPRRATSGTAGCLADGPPRSRTGLGVRYARTRLRGGYLIEAGPCTRAGERCLKPRVERASGRGGELVRPV
jgi:hypothetical protein